MVVMRVLFPSQVIVDEVGGQTTTGAGSKQLLAGLAAGAGLVACAIWVRNRYFVGSMVIEPYPAVTPNKISSYIQRTLINLTRKNVGTPWYPFHNQIDEFTRPTDNGHAVAGQARDSARRAIALAVSSTGGRRLEISPATAVDSNGVAIHRHYAVADLARPSGNAEDGANDIIVGIDVDYYIHDMDQFLALGLPMVFYTFSPLDVAGMDGECTYTIRNDRVKYSVSGGGLWEHQVWDWTGAGEFIKGVVGTTWSWLFGMIGFQKVIYHKVHHARPWSNLRNRAMVWTVPQHTHWECKWLPSDLNCKKLTRRSYTDPVRSAWNRNVFVTSEKPVRLMVSIGRAGDHATITMSKEDMDVLLGLENGNAVTSRMIGLGYTSARDLALFGQYFKNREVSVYDDNIVGRPTALVHWSPSFHCELPETSARAYASPVVTDENLLPMIKRWEVLSMSLERRVTEVRNNKVPGFRTQGWLNEFVELVVGPAGEGVPYSLEETASMLSKPSQILATKAIWDSIDMPPRRLIEAFVKNEPTLKAPRIISSFADARFLCKFSTFTLAFRDTVLHAERNRHWFCPGLTPKELATKVVDYVREVGEVIEGDFSNFDGRVSAWLQRNVMNAVLLRYFNRLYHDDLRYYTDMLISSPARAKRFGYQYEAGVGVKSGSPTTCDLNSVLNAALQYCAIRATHPELPKELAFRSIGLAFGDDSLFEKTYKIKFSKVCAEVGMDIKIEDYDVQSGVTFLARVFPNPLQSDGSFQDPYRTWRKLHITCRDPNVPLADAAIDRMGGYLVSDGLSPLVGSFARMIRRVYGTKASDELVRDGRKDRHRETPYWLTVGGSWPQYEADLDVMYEVAAYRTKIPIEVIRSRERDFDNATDALSHLPFEQLDGVNPYRDTLIGGHPVDGVNKREIDKMRDVHNQRANPGTSSPSSKSVQPGHRPTPQGTGRRDGEGVQQPERLPSQGGREGGARRGGPNQQAQVQTGRARRGRNHSKPGPGAGQPGGSGRGPRAPNGGARRDQQGGGVNMGKR